MIGKMNNFFQNNISTMKATTLNYKFSLFVIGILYFVFGFVTWLNGTLIPFLKIACELSDF